MLTVLQETLAEAHGLAMAATPLSEKVETRTEDAELRLRLAEMRRESEETRARCIAVEQRLDGELRIDVLAHANTIREKALDLVGAWFKAGTGPLAAWGFLAMAEAGEVAVWSAFASLAARATGEVGSAAAELATWALPIQEGHLKVALEGAVVLAEQDEPDADRWG